MIKLWNLNSICHLHCMGFIINFVLLYLLWFGIYLHLVTANKNLTNLLKAMLSLNPYCWLALHITWTPTFGEFMPHYSPQLVEQWTCVSSPLLSHTPHRRRTGGSRGATQRGVRFDLGGVSQLTFWCQGWTLVRSIFIFYFVRLPLCNKYSDYCDIYLYALCYYICCLLWRMYEMHPALSLKSGCDRSGIRGNVDYRTKPR
jgi:hypothetical protein